jgi:hypothetical protein
LLHELNGTVLSGSPAAPLNLRAAPTWSPSLSWADTTLKEAATPKESASRNALERGFKRCLPMETQLPPLCIESVDLELKTRGL